MECDGEAGTWDSADEEQQYWYDHHPGMMTLTGVPACLVRKRTRQLGRQTAHP